MGTDAEGPVTLLEFEYKPIERLLLSSRGASTSVFIQFIAAFMTREEERGGTKLCKRQQGVLTLDRGGLN